MGVNYVPISWNRDKRKYFLVICAFIALYLTAFVGFGLLFSPGFTVETLMIRSTGTLAFMLLTFTLCIGPLSRLDPFFLMLLYNRRHLGVSTFLIALIHGALSLFQFHALGNANPILSLFTVNTGYLAFYSFPFQVLGFIALTILLIMAVTSHDYWLNNLTPTIWKRLHMMVYLAYVALIGHVVLGYFNAGYYSEGFQMSKFGYQFFFSIQVLGVICLHLTSAWKTWKEMRLQTYPETEWVKVCRRNEVQDKRAKILIVGDQNIAVFRDGNNFYAVNNVCRHQHGPLGEGKIVEGCITCPWHGYQYFAQNGQSPPPYSEKLETYFLKQEGAWILLNPNANPPGTPVEPLNLSNGQ